MRTKKAKKSAKPKTENHVYKFGCRAPKEADLALQMLGQAWLYREDVRRAYNTSKREKRALLSGFYEAAHVKAYEEYEAARDEIGHVFAFEKASMWESEQEALNAEIRYARGRRGHLLDCGTYWLIEASMLAASKASELHPIKRQEWDDTGRIGAAIQSVAQFPALAWDHPRVSLTEPDEKKHAVLTIHVGALSNKRALTFPIKLHRPFPVGAVVKQVTKVSDRASSIDRTEACPACSRTKTSTKLIHR